MSPDPRERDLVKCEDMRIYAQRAVEYLGSRGCRGHTYTVNFLAAPGPSGAPASEQTEKLTV